MAEKAANGNKEHLYHSILSLNSMLDRRDTTCDILIWRIVKYSKLKKNVFYYKSTAADNNRWTLKLFKAKGTLFVSLSTNVVNKFVYFSILSHYDTTIIEGSESLEISGGLYISEFCKKAIEHPQFDFLANDQLIIQCRYDMKPAENRVMILPYVQNRDSADVFQLLYDLRDLYDSQMHHDLLLNVRTIKFPVHKQILSARSTVFAELFKPKDENTKEPEMSLNADPRIMQEVLLYIYSGELKVLDLDSMLEVYDISKTFQIACLGVKCLNFLCANVDFSNVCKILSKAKLLKDIRLKDVAGRFISEMFGSVPKSPQWDKILKEYQDTLTI